MTQEQRASDFDVAMQYLAEVCNTYAQTLEPVVKGPFVNQVNLAIRAVRDERDKLAAVAQEPVAEPNEV